MFNKAQVTSSLACAKGLEKDAASLFSQLSNVERNSISIANTNYKSGKSGQPCTH